MTKEELKASSQEAYNAIFAEGQAQGVKAERERAGSYLAFLDIDKDNVVKAVKEGAEFTSQVLAEMTVKVTSKFQATAIIADSAAAVTTTTVVDATEKEKKVEAFKSEIEASLKNYKF